MQYNGGPLIQNIKIEAVYYSPWESDPTLQAQQQYLDQYHSFITQSSFIDQLLTPFSVNAQVDSTGKLVPIPGETPQIIGHGTFLGDDFNQISLTVNPAVGYATLDDSSIQSMLENELKLGNVPAPDANTLYVVFAPPKTDVTLGGADSITAFLGYHSNFTDFANRNFTYAVLPYPTSPNKLAPGTTTIDDSLTAVGSHEIAEAITDPIGGSGWLDKQASENEIADKAQTAPLYTINDAGTGNNYKVVQLWAHVDGPAQKVTANGIYVPYLNYQAVEGTYSGVVGSFVELDGDTNPADFSVEVDWGDGKTSSSSGTTPSSTVTVASVGNGTFTVVGSHAYSAALPEGESNDFMSMIVNDLADSAKTTQDTQILITDAPLTGATLTATATEGQVLNGAVVATFTDPGSNPKSPDSDYVATIIWDDGNGATHSSQGSVIFTGTVTGGISSYEVVGNNATAYAEEGPHAITVVVEDPGGNSVTINSTANVTDPSVNVIAQSISATEGTVVSLAVATFTDPGANEPPGEYHASINWGDGGTSAGTISFANGVYTVSGSHTYLEEGTPTLTVLVQDDAVPDFTLGPAGPISSASAQADVAAAPMSVTAQSIGSTVNAQFRGIVGTYTQTGANETPANYLATINWGDNLPASSGSISLASGTFTVNGSHTYAQDGQYPLTLSVQNDPIVVTTQPASVALNHAQFQVGGQGFEFDSDSHTPAAGFLPVIFNVNDTAAQLALDIATAVNGAAGLGVNAAPNNNQVVLGGAATFDPLTSGLSASSTTGGTVVTSSATATVTDVPLNVIPLSIASSEGAVFNGAVATFKDLGGSPPPASYTATIDWGDSTISSGIVTLANGTYTVTGNHTYVEEGTPSPTLTIEHSFTPTATLAIPAVIIDVPILATGGATFTATEGGLSAQQTLATFTDPGGIETDAGAYAATIAWGDGTTTTNASISLGAGGQLNVVGAHTYVEEGTATVSVTITHDKFAAVTVTSQAVVADAAVAATGGFTFSALEGVPSTTQTVALFADPAGAEPLTDYSATILWGDGTSTTNATIIFDSVAQTFAVSGSHLYAVDAAAPIKVVVHHDAAPDITVTDTVQLADQSVLATGGMTISAVEGNTSVSQPLATFVDPAGADALGDYSASIAWGDGGTSAGTISSAGGTFTVSATHLYAAEETYPIKVVIHHDTALDATVAATANVSDPAVVPTGGFTFSGTEGAMAASQVVATFSDPGGPEVLNDYLASVDWGDGTSSIGTISFNAVGNLFTVTAPHLYLGEGQFTITATISHDAAPLNATTSTANIVDPMLVATGQFTVSAVEGANSAVGTLATFTDPGGNEPLANYAATVAWGDGSVSAGIVGFDNTHHVYTVTGNHVYTEQGFYSAAVSIHHGTAIDSPATSVVNVSDAPLAPTGGYQFSAAEGTLSAVETLATFTDPGGVESTADYSATVLWGDGATLPGLVTGPDGNGVFTVSGSHIYSEEGAKNITIVMHHDVATNVTVASQATVADQSVTVSGGLTVTAAEGAMSSAQPLATFVDPAGNEAMSDYTATVAWGDATSSPGTITFNGGLFTVSAAHLYAEEGSQPITVTVHHDSAPDASGTSQAVVSDAAVVASGGYTFAATEGVAAATQTVANFYDPGGKEAIGDYSANIAWGDGVTSPGTIGFDAQHAVFTVAGAHLYASTGSQVITVVIQHDSATPVTVTSQAAIADPAVIAQGGFTVSALEQVVTSNQTVATFTDPGGGEPTSGYSAQIAWGDGSITPGTITGSAVADQYTVSGQHVYTAEGASAITVVIQHGNAPNATVASTAQAADAPVIAQGGFTVSATSGVAFSGQTVATFYDPVGPDGLAVYSANIAWGDGGTSAGSIAFNPVTNLFTVSGGHDYAVGGQFPITVTVHHETAVDTTTTSQANVVGPPFSGQFVSIAANEMTAFNGVVATLTNANPTGVSATIAWGDGTTTAGVVAGGSTIVTGTHTYRDEGSFSVTITVTEAGNTLQLSGTALIAPAVLPVANPTPSQFFVAEVYEDLLGRPVDLSGLNHWTGQLALGLARGDLVKQLEQSDEYFATIVRPDYEQFLGREPEPAGMSYWIAQMHAGLTDEQMQADFVGSPEYYARSGGTNAGWVTAMYRDLLNRAPDVAGLNFWLQQLALGFTRTQVAYGFTSSPEREAVWTNGIYQQYLGRAASPTEVEQAVVEITQSGLTREDVIALTLSTGEYFTRAQGD
jgi:hypothetical protein